MQSKPKWKGIRHSGSNEQLEIYTSFVLRCQIIGAGKVRSRLVDVRTGSTYTLGELDGLPQVISRLLQPLMDASDQEV